MTIRNLYITRAKNGFVVSERDPMRGPIEQDLLVARNVDELCDVLREIEPMLSAAPQPAAVKQDLTTAQGDDDGSPEVWINRCPVNHDRRATCPRCHSTRPPGAVHGQPVLAANPQPEAKAGADDEKRSCAFAYCAYRKEGGCKGGCFALSQPKPAEGGAVADTLLRDAGLPKVADALLYSENFAEANPHLTQTAKDHIFGLCQMIRVLAPLANSAPAAAKADDGGAVAWQVVCVKPGTGPTTYRCWSRDEVVEAKRRAGVEGYTDEQITVRPLVYGDAPAAATRAEEVEALAARIGVYYGDGAVRYGAPLYAFTPTELAEFARRLAGKEE